MRFARTLAVAVLLPLVFSVLAQAQAQNKPAQFVQWTITTVRPSAINDYEEFVKKVNAARDKTPGSPRVLVYAVNLGGPAFTFYQLTEWEKWADREKFPNGGQMLTKVYGQAETARLQKMQRDAIVQQRSEVFAYNANASLNPRVVDPPAAFINLQRNVQGAGFVAYQAVALAKLSDRDLQNPNAGDSLRKIYGNAEATQVQDILNRAIRNRQQIFLAYRPDLSHPKATGTSN